MFNLTKLDVPKRVTTAEGHVLLGTERGIMFDTLTDDKGVHLAVKLPDVIESGLGRNTFSLAVASKEDVNTIDEDGGHHVKRENVFGPYHGNNLQVT